MDHQGMACVLPSNGPIFQEQDYRDERVQHPYRHNRARNGVLQERSNNRGDPYPANLNAEDQDFIDRAWELFDATEARFVANARRGGFKALEGDVHTIQTVVTKSRKLWGRLWKCKGFFNYRKRQPRDDCAPVRVHQGDKKDDPKWEDLAEVAFCRALAVYPAIGRRKVQPAHDSKQRGRNELIADLIAKETGKERLRKQVSSHIQVLKPYLKPDAENPGYHPDPDGFISSFLCSSKLEDLKHLARKARLANERKADSQVNSIHSRRYMSTYIPNNRQYPGQQPLPSPYTALPSNHGKPAIDAHKPRQFEMFVRDTSRHSIDPRDDIVHEFSSFRKPRPECAAFAIHDLDRLVKEFPQLEGFAREDLCRTQIISSEATLCLCKALPKNGELGISFELYSDCNLDRYREYICTTRFYENGKIMPFSKGGHNVVEARDNIEYLSKERRLNNVSFGSDFWARKVMESIRVLKRAGECRKEAALLEGQEALDLELEAGRLEIDLRASFESLTALQEISAWNRETHQTEKLLLVCWKFEQTRDNGIGQTTWRNVIVSPSARGIGHASLPVKEESLQNVGFDFGAPPGIEASADSGMTLQRPFDPNTDFAMHDYSDMTMAGITSTAASGGAQGPMQLYSDNDFDFNGGHMQLHLNTQLPVSMAMQAYNDGSAVSQNSIVYDQGQHWQQMPSYPDPYFEQNGYVPIRGYGEHQDSPYSEAGAQQHSQHDISPVEEMPLQHSATLHPDVMVQHAITKFPEVRSHLVYNAVTQHSEFQDPRAQDNLSPELALQSVECVEHRLPDAVHVAIGRELGPEQALQSVEYVERGVGTG